jgi:hypothetical protein
MADINCGDSKVECGCATYQRKLAAWNEGRTSDKDYSPVPQGGDGEYFLDLEEVMKDELAPTSKQVIIPFLKEKNFTKLVIKSTHVPPWFYVDFPELGVKADAQKQDDGKYNIIVTLNEE